MAEDYPVRRHGPPRDLDGTRVRYGGCSCGAVRFEIRGEPDKVGICHCTECRKASGSAFVAYADWPPSALTVTGEAREHRGRSFCPTCGTRLFSLTDTQAEIMLGALDDAPGDLVPDREGWIIRRESWLPPLAGAGQYQRDPA